MKYAKRKLANTFLILGIILSTHFVTYAQQLQSIEPGDNPTPIVKLGDAVNFPVTLYNGASISLGATELEIKVPNGWEIISATPALKAGSLSADKRTARVALTTDAMSSTPVSIQLKPLCTAVSEAGFLTYNWYQDATLLVTKNTAPIGNFIDPIIRFTPPAEQSIKLLTPATRIWSVEQTAVGSYVNNLTIEFACNTTVLEVRKLELIKEDGTLITDITSCLAETTAAKYVYKLGTDQFNKVGNLNGRLEAGEKLFVRETVQVKNCTALTPSYKTAYGDGTSTCGFGAVNPSGITVMQPGYNPDIITQRSTWPTAEPGNGKLTFKVYNNSTDLEADMKNIFVSTYGTDYNTTLPAHLEYKRAYFSDDLGNPVSGLNDIPLQNNAALGGGFPTTFNHKNIWIVRFDMLNDPSKAATYQSLGLSDLDGDGVYNDIKAKGTGTAKPITITVEYDINFEKFADTDCSTNISLQSGVSRLAYIHYKNTCDNYVYFMRGYSAEGSTHIWMGEFKHPRPTISLSKQNVSVGEVVNLNVAGNHNGNGNSGYLTLYTGDNIHSTTVKLPKGFEYNAAGGIKINGTAVPVGNITVIAPNEVLFKNGGAVAMLDTYTISIKAIDEATDVKTAVVKHHFKRKNTTKTYDYACHTVPVNYTILKPCTRLELASFSAERTSFGWTDNTKTTRATKATPGINIKVAGPYDNVSFIGSVNVNSNIALSAGESVKVEVSYEGLNGSGNYYFGKGQGARFRYKKSGGSFGSYVNIPPASITQGFVAAKNNLHSLIVDLTPYIGSGKDIDALQSGDVLEVELLAQTMENSLPTQISLINNMSMEVYTEVASVKNLCTPLVDDFRIVNYVMATVYSSNNSATYYTNAQAYFNSARFWVSSPSAVNRYFTNEWRPNAIISNFNLTFHSFIRVDEIITNQSSIAASKYNVTYTADGKTIVTIPGPFTEEMWWSQWSGYNINVKWTAICWTSTATTIKYDMQRFPTSALGETAAELKETDKVVGSDLGLTIQNYSYTLTTASKTAVPQENKVSWDLLLTNKSHWASSDGVLPNSWIAVELPAGVTPTKLIDLSTNTEITDKAEYESGKWWWKLGNIDVPAARNYRLECTYTACSGKPTLKVRYGSSGILYPTNPKDGFPAPYNVQVCRTTPYVDLDFTPPIVEFSGKLEEKDKNTSGNYVFCTPIRFETSFTNGLENKVYNLKAKVKLPVGVEWAGNAKAKLGSGSYVTIPAGNITTVGQDVTISLPNTIVLDSYSSLGNPNGTAVLEFQLKTTCGFINATEVYANLTGESVCGAAYTVNVNSGKIKIEGISGQIPSYVIDVSSFTSTFRLDSSTSRVKLQGSIKLVSAGATPNDFVFIDLPTNMQLESSGAASNLQFTQSGNQLIAPLPSTGVFGDTKNFDINLKPLSPEAWLCQSYDIVMKYGIKKDLPCTGVPGGSCPIVGYGDNTSTNTFTVSKLDLSLTNITLSGKYKNATTETITIIGKLKNNGTTVASNVKLGLYLDNNNNGQQDAGEPLATGSSTFTITSIAAGAEYTINQQIDVPASEVCKLIFAAASGSDNPYVCAGLSAKPAVGYVFAAPSPTICQGSSLTIGDPAITSYAYSWDATYITGSTTAQPVFTYTAATTITTPTTVVDVPVTITRTGGCSVNTKVSVTVEALPVLTISNATANEGGMLTFTLTLTGNKCNGSTVSVTCSTADGSATAVSGDYTTVTNQVVTFGAAETSKTFTVQTKQDKFLENPETLRVVLSNPVGCKYAPGTEGTGTINDQTNGAIMVEKVSDASEPNNAGKFKIRFVDNEVESTYPVYVYYTITGLTLNTDYTIDAAQQSPITIPINTKFVEVNIKPKDNYVVEGSRSVTITLTNATK